MAAPDIAALGQEIYRQLFDLQEEDPKQVFHQADIFDLGVLPDDAEGKDDVMLALQVLQKLADEKLLKVVHHEGMGWKIRTEDEAKKYRGLSSDEEIVYSHIDEANDEGIWMRNIKIRSGLHEAVIAAALKKLKTRNMIQDMKSVEHPARKMYIKSNLSPSERATGGPWYTDGELDEDFIEMVMKILFDYISKRTFYFSKSYGPPSKTPKKVVRKMSPEEARAKRDQVLGAEEEMDEKTTRMIAYEKHLPMPAGYQKYPTLDELTVWIEKGNYFSQTLTANELQQLLDVMVFDDRIEMVITGEGKAYRALRRSLLSEDDRGSVLTEAPCGRCPVFDLCEEGGPVGPSNCEYFNDWLGL
ncbi:related to RPC34-DNA-directed RNA polymerase III, 34 KD subunit [Phialocephala subalpina]|uniref:DNA-directed RNA polymerase III subunit RPC6 n=1 Tax=Phialocephala subalpina TaxID=576137 RepID=A0A1L7WR78_9HELO|nr:related to RPC34-DNA-directed RNA polymerase III, 34 KD subunit [Phialocephala subalpina]